MDQAEQVAYLIRYGNLLTKVRGIAAEALIEVYHAFPDPNTRPQDITDLINKIEAVRKHIQD